MLLTEQAVLHSTPEDFSNNTENIIGERTNSITEASSVRNVPGEEIISKTTSSQEKGKGNFTFALNTLLIVILFIEPFNLTFLPPYKAR
jgi:hypothetical protein